MEKENWINEVMESTKGMKPVDANPFLFEKIISKIEQKRKKDLEIKSFSKNWALAAVLIIIINLVSFGYIVKDRSNNKKEVGYMALSKEMGLPTNYNY